MTDYLAASPLGKKISYTDQYDPNLLFSISRDQMRSDIGIDVQDLPFIGIDIWNDYDFTWLNAQNQAEYGMLSIYIPCDSPNLLESKSLKLYLYSFANSQFQNVNEIAATIQQDLSAITGASVRVMLANIVLDFTRINAHFPGTNIDNQAITCTEYNVNPKLLICKPGQVVSEELCSDLLKFNCATNNKPNYGSVQISYTGPQIDQASLLKYLVSYRNEQQLQEQCIERIYYDILNYCKPRSLTVTGRYTRRGGLDINPVRSNVEFDQHNARLFRQ